MRKWTWLFLPAIALGATWVTVRMSWASLGEQGYVRTLSVADLGTDSQVDRTTRFELEFSPIEETQVVDLSGVYRIDYQMSNLGRDVSAEMNERWQTGLARAETRTGIPIRYEGGIPGAYDVWQPMRQWSPRLFRDTTFGRDERVDDSGLSQIDWHALELLDWTTKEGRNAIASLIHAVNPDARVRIRIGLHNSDVAAADQPASEEPAISKLEEKRFQSLFDTIAGATSQLPEGLDGKPIGLFGMVYERAPTCGPDLEDLAMLDPQDNRQAVLLVGIPGADTVIFRKRLTLKK